MSTIRRIFGAEITLYVSAKDVTLAGVETPLNVTGARFWIKRLVGVTAQDIPGASIVPADAGDVAALKYAGDKAAATWLKLLLPGGFADGSFAMLNVATIALYVGMDEATARPILTPFVVERITTGDEGVS